MTNWVAKSSIFPTSSNSGVNWLFTTTLDGNLATHVGDDPERVRSHRQTLIERVGHPIAWMDQVHGDQVLTVDSQHLPDRSADAEITADPALALGVLVADCIPLLLWSKECIAVAHVGRRGVANEIASKTVERMRVEFGASDVEALIGPAICGSCYEVPMELHDEVARRWPTASSRTPQGTPALDLPVAVAAQLESLGLVIHHDRRCTREEPSLYSYRRDSGSGRFAGVIWR